ncbi:uncharacterized protein B0P05DRAFT_540884, partial [Gilbertella persicaria]|uniref:uncharacterized protein n=1 Tax=Gilbertella persicaria TaxID=101096 RepID=UPI002220E28E
MNSIECLQEECLFEDKYISKEVQSSLHEGYRLYPLRSNDYERGYLDVLSVLTEVGNHTPESWHSQFQFMKKHNDTCKSKRDQHKSLIRLDFTVTITDETNDRIAATGTILIEHKFVHKNGLVGKKLGLRIIEALKYIGQVNGCYKVILDCAVKNIPFYEKCGFTPKESQMAWYIPQTQEKSHL